MTQLIAPFDYDKTDAQIALFMGAVVDFQGRYSIYQHYLQQHDSELKYHKCWDGWLETVVEKIESMGYTFSLSSAYHLKNRNEKMFFVAKIKDVDGELTCRRIDKERLGAAYKAVITFIDFYNRTRS